MDEHSTQFEGAKIETTPSSASIEIFHGTILKEIRSWGTTLLILGAMHIFAAGFLNASWGIILIIVGLASFYFRSSAMLVIYAVTLAWAGVSNIMSGAGIWMGFAFIQWFLAFRVFQKFVGFQKAERNFQVSELHWGGLTPNRTAAAFPWVAALLGVLSVIGLVGVFVGALVSAIVSEANAVPRIFVFAESLVMNLGVLGFAVGLASILARHPRRFLAIAGMVAGAFTCVVELILAIF